MRLPWCRLLPPAFVKSISHHQIVRTTYMVKRVVKPPPTDFNSKTPYIAYKEEHFWYKMVQDTKDVKDQEIAVVLLEFIEGIGQEGEVVLVDAHYARYNLLLQKKAVYASPENIKEYAVAQDSAAREFSSHTVPMTIRKLASQIISVPVSSTVPWRLQPWHVETGMRISGIAVPKGGVEIPEEEISGPDLEKQNKDFLAYVVINNKERAPVRCRIHHANQDLPSDWMFSPSEPLFPSQAEALNRLPLPQSEEKIQKVIADPRKWRKRD